RTSSSCTPAARRRFSPTRARSVSERAKLGHQGWSASGLMAGSAAQRLAARAAPPLKIRKPHLDEMHGPESLPSAPTARPRENPCPPAAAKSSSPPTPANPVPSSAPPRAPAAARRDIGADGRSGRSIDDRYPQFCKLLSQHL